MGEKCKSCILPGLKQSEATIQAGGWLAKRQPGGPDRQCTLAAKQANCTLDHISKNVAIRAREGILLSLALVRLHLEYCVRFRDPSIKTDIEILEWVHLRAPEAGRGLTDWENGICLAVRGEGSREILSLLQLTNGRVQRRWRQIPRGEMKGSGHKVEQRKFWLDDHLDKALSNLI